MNNLVEISKDKQVVTTSVRVAEVFGKQHSHVIRAINNIIGDLRDNEDLGQPQNGETFKNGQSNFGLSSYFDKQGKQQKQYIMNRDGFTLLAMGFTGSKALKFKLQYIQAFNEMEAKLRKIYPCGMDSRVKHGNDVKGKEITGDKPVEVVAHTRSLPSGRKEIVLSEKAKAEIGGIVKNCLAAALEGKRPGISGLPKKKLPVTVFSRKSNEACCMDCRVKPDNDSSLAGIGPKMTEGRGCPNMMETLSRNWPDNDGREIKPEGDDKKSLTMTAEIDYNKLSAGVGGWVSMTLMSARYDDLKREAESLRRQAELCEKQAAETWKSVKKIESALGI